MSTPEQAAREMLNRMGFDGDGCTAGDVVELANLIAAGRDAVRHTDELEEAWRRGCIQETDGKGGTRSNRNVEVNRSLRAALPEPAPAR